LFIGRYHPRSYMKRLRKTMKGSVIITGYQSHSHGVASECNVPTKNLGAATWILQNIKEKLADQPTKKCATTYLSTCWLC